MVLTAIYIALCVVLPIAFHAIPGAGSLFSPMHIPAFLCGLTCGPFYGICCGIVGPIISSLLTGMPMAAYLPGMIVELAVYGFACGLMMKWIHTGRLYTDLYISLGTAMLLGRIAAGAAQALIFSFGEYSFAIWFGSYIAGTLPAIIAHLVIIPLLILSLERARMLPPRY